MSLQDYDCGKSTRRLDSVLDLDIHDDGHARLFCGRAAARDNDAFFLFETIIAGLTIRFLWTMGRLYERARYVGTVDVGLMITGMKGTHSCSVTRTIAPCSPMTEDTYMRTTRISAIGLTEASHEAARTLVMPLVRASTRGTKAI